MTKVFEQSKEQNPAYRHTVNEFLISISSENEKQHKQPKNEQGNAEMIDGKLNIWIDKQNVPKELTEALKTRTVTYKADYPLSAELCKQLKIDNYTIKKGVYNYTIKEDKIHLIL